MQYKTIFLSAIITLSGTLLQAMEDKSDYQDSDFSVAQSIKSVENEHGIQLFKQKISKILADNDDLSHLKEDSPLLDLTLYNDCVDLLPQLLAKGANPNVIEKVGIARPLTRAIVAQKIVAMSILIRKGAMILPEDLACAIDFGFADGVELLLKKGANPNTMIKNAVGKKITPLMKAMTGSYSILAENRAAITETLRKHGAHLLDTEESALANMKEHHS